jgi:hypothetical protein
MTTLFIDSNLAKQGWYLLTSPDLFNGCLFESKYFPPSNFLEAVLGHNPS